MRRSGQTARVRLPQSGMAVGYRTSGSTRDGASGPLARSAAARAVVHPPSGRVARLDATRCRRRRAAGAAHRRLESQQRRRRSWRNGSELSSMSSCGFRRVQPRGAMREERRQPLRALRAPHDRPLVPTEDDPSAERQLRRDWLKREAPTLALADHPQRLAGSQARGGIRPQVDGPRTGERGPTVEHQDVIGAPPARRRGRARRAASSCPRPCRRAVPTLRPRRRTRPHGSSLGPANARPPPRRPRGEDEPAPDRLVASVARKTARRARRSISADPPDRSRKTAVLSST